jgi:hypothetical protein
MPALKIKREKSGLKIFSIWGGKENAFFSFS